MDVCPCSPDLELGIEGAPESEVFSGVSDRFDCFLSDILCVFLLGFNDELVVYVRYESCWVVLDVLVTEHQGLLHEDRSGTLQQRVKCTVSTSDNQLATVKPLEVTSGLSSMLNVLREPT